MVGGEPTVTEIIDVLEDTFKDAVTITEIPRSKRKNNAAKQNLHDLEGAKKLMNFWLAQDKEDLHKVFRLIKKFLSICDMNFFHFSGSSFFPHPQAKGLTGSTVCL